MSQIIFNINTRNAKSFLGICVVYLAMMNVKLRLPGFNWYLYFFFISSEVFYVWLSVVRAHEHTIHTDRHVRTQWQSKKLIRIKIKLSSINDEQSHARWKSTTILQSKNVWQTADKCYGMFGITIERKKKSKFIQFRLEFSELRHSAYPFKIRQNNLKKKQNLVYPSQFIQWFSWFPKKSFLKKWKIQIKIVSKFPLNWVEFFPIFKMLLLHAIASYH